MPIAIHPKKRCRRSVLAVLLALAGFGLSSAGAEEPSPYATWGQELYRAHCASCHGETGGGDGPAAASLKTAPADLTVIAMAHDGRFPRSAVARFIGGEFPPGVHGSREMPIWGQVFRERHPGIGSAAVAAEIHALTGYIESLQRRK